MECHDQMKGSKRILIIGEAGAGKTILCASIAEDWANGNLFQEFIMILLLPLNQKGVASAQNLLKLFRNCRGFDGATCSTVAAYLMANIIADGWHELCESDNQQESFLHRLLLVIFFLAHL